MKIMEHSLKYPKNEHPLAHFLAVYPMLVGGCLLYGDLGPSRLGD